MRLIFQQSTVQSDGLNINLKFKADRLQMIVVAKKISVLQLFISRMPKMCAILHLVSAPLNSIPIAEHFRRSHPQCEHSYGQHIYMSKENTFELCARSFLRIRSFNVVTNILRILTVIFHTEEGLYTRNVCVNTQ